LHAMRGLQMPMPMRSNSGRLLPSSDSISPRSAEVEIIAVLPKDQSFDSEEPEEHPVEFLYASVAIPGAELLEADDDCGPEWLGSDPFGRDAPATARTSPKLALERLSTYVSGVVCKIDDNLRHGLSPSEEKFDRFLSKLVCNMRRRIQDSPRNNRKHLVSIVEKSFVLFWNFRLNQKIRNSSPEELKEALLLINQSLFAELANMVDNFSH